MKDNQMSPTVLLLALCLAFLGCSPAPLPPPPDLAQDLTPARCLTGPPARCLTGPVNITGTLDGIGYSYEDGGTRTALSIRVTSASAPVAELLGLELLPDQVAQVALGTRRPATISASGVYSPACESFYNDGRPCLRKGACVVVTYE